MRIIPNSDDIGVSQWDDDDFKPSRRESMHEDEKLCKWNLGRVVSTVPLEIRSSFVCDGSGLFAGAAIPAGREIYHAVPILDAISADNSSFCSYCLKDTQEVLGGPSKANEEAKACSNCRAARFCSKKCQRSAWNLYHKDECKILRKTPDMTAQTLFTHRLVFYQQRGFLQTAMARSLSRLENHFQDYTKDPERSQTIYDIAAAVRETTGEKVQIVVPWRLLPAMRTNCVPLRPASSKKPVGYAFDVVTAMINHSCDPNAFVYFEGNELRVRSIRPITAGEEITICYVDPTLILTARKAFLQREYFFDCSCNRCKAELKEQSSLLKGTEKLSTLPQYQQDMVQLISAAIKASKYPGVFPDYEDPAAVETKLRTITVNAFPSGKHWPEHMEPLPSARLSLAMLYLEKGQPVPALRNALKGQLLSIRKKGPVWVNDMMNIITILIVAASLPPDSPAFKDKIFPLATDLQNVTLGYFVAAAYEASGMFGSGAEYAKGISHMTSVMGAQKGPPLPGTKEFIEVFVPAQRKLLEWAGIPEKDAIVIRGV